MRDPCANKGFYASRHASTSEEHPSGSLSHIPTYALLLLPAAFVPARQDPLGEDVAHSRDAGRGQRLRPQRSLVELQHVALPSQLEER